MRAEDRIAMFFDIDGTLIGDDHTIPDSARQAIEEARRLGHLAFINSGRCYSMLRTFESQIEMDGMLAGCGTEIVIDGKRTFYKAASHETTRRLIEADYKYKAAFVLEGSDSVHYRENPVGLPDVERVRKMTADIGAVSSEPYEGEYEISKFCIQTDENSDIEGIKAEFGEEFDIVYRGHGFYECVPRGFTKGTALLLLLEECNIRPENAYVFGDSSNDLAMFEVCRNAISMKQHDKVLDPYTTYVTDTPENDGIMKAMKHFSII